MYVTRPKMVRYHQSPVLINDAGFPLRPPGDNIRTKKNYVRNKNHHLVYCLPINNRREFMCMRKTASFSTIGYNGSNEQLIVGNTLEYTYCARVII